MSDNPNSGKEVQMDSALVKQKHRMAAGEKVTGQTLPPAPKPEKNQA